MKARDLYLILGQLIDREAGFDPDVIITTMESDHDHNCLSVRSIEQLSIPTKTKQDFNEKVSAYIEIIAD